ncbi:subclass IId bacteriocin thuricin17 [Rummeliibacillus suwonensis]
MEKPTAQPNDWTCWLCLTCAACPGLELISAATGLSTAK